MNGIIYKCTSPSGKSYIGKTSRTLEKRIYYHYKCAKNYNHKFAHALKKYNKIELQWEILYIVPIEQLDLAEVCAIYTYDTYYNGYNSTLGGEESPMNNLSTRKKVSNTLKGKYAGERNPFYGKQHTMGSRKKMSSSRINKYSGQNNAFFGKKHSKESKEKIAKSKIKNKYLVITPCGENIVVVNLKEYCRKNNLNSGNMYQVAKGNKEHYKYYKVNKMIEDF